MYVGDSLNDLFERAHFRDVVLAIGVFDGVHRGHQRIVAELLRLSREHDASPVIVTFHPHPRAVLYPEGPPQYLTITPQKSRMFGRMGVKGMVVLPFSMDMANMAPWDFLYQYILDQGPRIRAICVGRDWEFGRASEKGDISLLQAAGRKHKFEVTAVSPLYWYRYPVSSTRIRKAIMKARLRHGGRMLTRPHTIRGTVESGRAQGHDVLDCPTANLADPLILLPPPGVYAATALIKPDAVDNVERHNAVAYYGQAPTLRGNDADAHHRTIEIHLFHYEGNLYDQTLEIELHQLIRPSVAFNSPSELKEQIRKDSATAQRLLPAECGCVS